MRNVQYGVGGTRQGQDWIYPAVDPITPIGPGVSTQDAWWFRGPIARGLAPPAGQVTLLPAGGSIMIEITCHIAWTSMGWATTVPFSKQDACPLGNVGPWHANDDPNSPAIDEDLISGCALAIADVDDISKTTMDNLVIFSTQENCPHWKQTTFDIPAMMPACTGTKLAERGAANFYMTAFDCKVTNVNPAATKIAPPQDAVLCLPSNSTCKLTAGAKRPLYAYNNPTNVVFPIDINLFNFYRPAYNSIWSFGISGAQTDIFLPAARAAKVAASSSAKAVSSSSAKASSSVKASSSIVASSSVKPSSSVKAKAAKATAAPSAVIAVAAPTTASSTTAAIKT
ncbi:hypothetical protein RQP46_007325 [Phenoliferia psychrophenolica]